MRISSIWKAKLGTGSFPAARRLAVAAVALGVIAGAAHGQQGAPPSGLPAAGVSVNLNITPKRLILDRGSRSGTVYIFNQGNAPASFDITLGERVMMPSGEIKPIAEARADPQLRPIADRLSSAQSLLVATPRRVLLAPGKGQTIRVRASQPPAGATEHRTHLTVTTVPPRDAGVTAEQAQAQQSGRLSFRITSVFGLSIPVFVRSGPVDARGAIENVRSSFANISPDGTSPPVRTPVLLLDIRRLGSSSLFGNLEVKGARGREDIGAARGVGVYAEIDRRSMQIPLRRSMRPGEQLTITFTDDDASPGQVIAKSLFSGG